MEGLGKKIEASTARLHAVQHFLPSDNSQLMAAGPLDERGWCIVVQTSAMSSKLRQMLPLISRHLANVGLPTPVIRIHVTRE
jgi:hypothetical protein